MMKRITIIFVILLSLTVTAHADLDLLGQGTSGHGTYNLIYDTDLDITWYDYANDPNGWDNQIYWAESLTVDFGGTIYNDWRLTSTVDGSFVYGYNGTTTGGWNITSSEMGHLFYTELGNEGTYDTSGNLTGCGKSNQPSCLSNTGDFQNLWTGWSGTEYSIDPDMAWTFDTNGFQSNGSKGPSYYAMAVMDGMAKIPVVPEPISSTLFIVGGATLGFRRFRKRIMN